ncbi:MAG: UPF0182 family protein [Cyanobacteriota bacterium]|nr:UPF0182 family protein [Cyanobacteriota bacterium]
MEPLYSPLLPYPVPAPLPKRRERRGYWLGGVIIFVLLLWGGVRLGVELLWFGELDYLSVFLTRLAWQVGVGAGVFAVSLVLLSHCLGRADALSREIGAVPQTRSLKLPWFLALLALFYLLLGALAFYYGQVALEAWTVDFTLPALTPQVPQPFGLGWILGGVTQWQTSAAKGLTVIALTLGLVLLRGRPALTALTLGLSALWALTLAGNWTRVAQFFYRQPFGAVDPQFGLDLGFYVFNLPALQLLTAWLKGLTLLALLGSLLSYLQAGSNLSEGKFPGFTCPQRLHLYRVGAGFTGVLALGHVLQRYQYLYARHDVLFGANYADVHLRLPVETFLAIFCGALALWLLVRGCRAPAPILKRPSRPRGLIYLWPLWLYLSLLLTQNIGGWLMEWFIVQPNQLSREYPFLERSIAATRAAFNLAPIQSLTLSGRGQLDRQILEANRPTVDNIRLWDPIPLLKTNRQLQQIRLYYQFPSAYLDRYQLQGEKGKIEETIQQQTLIAPRELDYQAIPAQAQTWVNQHLVYTHGYGFTLSPVNRVDQGGLPYYFVKDIGTDTEESALRTSSEQIRTSIPIGKPRIYFGELTNNYIMTNTKIKEFDFPRGQDNAYTTYDGAGGIVLSSWLKRGLFSLYLRDWQMLFTRNFKPETKILIRRNINQRLRELAPFLRFDREPYLVAAKLGNSDHSALYWIADAYTTSANYPYSDPGLDDKNQLRNFNYIRNSVKIAISAYDGDVHFYAMDPQDPLIRSWQAIFPELFQPFSRLPDPLQRHIRYPIDLFSAQSERLLTYHMTDPGVFYNREDQWQIPREIYGNEQKPIAPYYLIMKLAGIQSKREEFVLSQVYTPISRSNLIALLFARCDEENYGKLLLYTLPKERLVYGPEQIEALINQDPIISERISLWNREGSKVIQGNLLVIPIEEALLYVEPFYLEAEKNSLPTLVRVVAVYGNQIAMAETLQGAIDAIFSPPPAPEIIVQPLESASGSP